MPHISNIELENLRHLIGSEQLEANKARVFAGQVNDPQLRAFLEKKARGADQKVQKLGQCIGL